MNYGTPTPGLGPITSGMPMPQPTTLSMPSITQDANAPGVPSVQPNMIPSLLDKPMPSIVNSAPAVMPSCPMAQCDTVTSWVSANPLLAGLIVAGLWYLVAREKR